MNLIVDLLSRSAGNDLKKKMMRGTMHAGRHAS
jgi:hypothetical protein